MGKLADKFKDPTAPLVKPSEPLWKGPESDDKLGGITFSMLSRFIVCRERFRLYALEGIRARDVFNSKIDYGNMWHEGEEAHAANKSWQDAILKYAQKLSTRYPFSRDEIDHWYRMAMTQFPVYAEYWAKNQDVEQRTPLLQEQVFKVPYKLPSGRVVYLRGKWDAVDLIGSGRDDGIYIQENKTKSQIDQKKITRQLTCDLQSMMYMVALQELREVTRKTPVIKAGGAHMVYLAQNAIKGVRYNVIRRSAHKSPESMYKKMTEDIADNRGGEWFSRWKIEITPGDIENFKQRTLSPILEQLCDWYVSVSLAKKHDISPFDDIDTKVSGNPKPNTLHWQHPFGIYSPMDQGAEGEVDKYMEDGSMVGLHKVTTLFTELNNE